MVLKVVLFENSKFKKVHFGYTLRDNFIQKIKIRTFGFFCIILSQYFFFYSLHSEKLTKVIKKYFVKGGTRFN